MLAALRARPVLRYGTPLDVDTLLLVGADRDDDSPLAQTLSVPNSQ